MFFGTYEHTIDEKGRLVIPRKMREEAGVRLFIMKGFDGALSLFKEVEFERLTREFNSLPFSKKTKTNKSAKSVININWYIVAGTEIYKEIDKCANLG